MNNIGWRTIATSCRVVIAPRSCLNNHAAISFIYVSINHLETCDIHTDVRRRVSAAHFINCHRENSLSNYLDSEMCDFHLNNINLCQTLHHIHISL